VRYLMCPPEHFRLEYAINPWMRVDVAVVDRRRAYEEWLRLRHVMESIADVEIIEPEAGLPDMVFAANGAFALGRDVLIGRYRHQERRGEEARVRAWFASRNYTIHELPEGVPFEGTGDAILDRSGRWIWAGEGFRSDRRAHDVLARCFNMEVVSLHLVDERYYHLDTCFAPLTGGYVMYYPAAFDAASRRAIEDRVPRERRIVVSDADAAAFACNVANVGRVVVAHALSAELRERLEGLGFAVAITPVSEFLKAGGAVFCMMLRLEDEPIAAAGRSCKAWQRRHKDKRFRRAPA